MKRTTSTGLGSPNTHHIPDKTVKQLAEAMFLLGELRDGANMAFSEVGMEMSPEIVINKIDAFRKKWNK